MPLEVGVDHPLTGCILMIDPHDTTAFRQLTSKSERLLAITRITEAERERRLLGSPTDATY